jgi:hypothetical protein
MDSLKVDDVLEVPTDQNIDTGDCGEGNMQGISAHALPDCAVLDVSSREFLCLGGQRGVSMWAAGTRPRTLRTASGAATSSRSVSSESTNVSSPP